MNTDKREQLKKRLQKVPLQPGVYLFKNTDNQVIYVGKSRKLRNRMRSYFQAQNRLHIKVRAMMQQVDDFDYIVTASELEALILENNLIKSYRPRYNIQLRDDKTYPWLKITVQDTYPRMVIAREKKDPRQRYFGPYPNVTVLRSAIHLLNKIFPLRTCQHMQQNRRPCLNYDLGQCLAPCCGLISKESYAKVVKNLIQTLEGGCSDLLVHLQKQMIQASQNLEFEKAAKFRDEIAGLQELGQKYQVNVETKDHFDLVGMIMGEMESLLLVFQMRSGVMVGKSTFWLKKFMDESQEEIFTFFLHRYYDEQQYIPSEILVNIMPDENELLQYWLTDRMKKKITIRIPQRGEKKQLMNMLLENAQILWEERYEQDIKNWQTLQGLAELLHLEVIPQRIECYDISHLAGQETVASMIVFTNGVPDHKAYRHFKMKEDRNDDFLSMKETLARRFREARKGNPAFLPEPDLVLIDGGLGQVNAVQEIFHQLNIEIPLYSLAKKQEEIYAPGCSKPWTLSRHDERLKLLQRMRDEAHRFAITYNRQRRGKRMLHSALDSIPGIGEKRRQELLQHFGSVARIKQASIEDIAALPSMNRKVAENLQRYLK